MATVHELDLNESPSFSSEWEDLLERAGNASIFLTWEWLMTWWEVFGKCHESRWLVVKGARGKWMAGAPFYLRRTRSGLLPARRELRFIGTGASVSPEHLDLVVDPLHQTEALEALQDYFVGHFSDWDVLELTDITRPEADAFWFSEALLNRGATVLVEEQKPAAPTIFLPDSWEEYFESLKPRMRTQVARYRRKVAGELGARTYLWSPQHGNLEAALWEFENLFADRKMSVGIGNKFDSAPGYRKFHHLLADRFAKRGWLWLAFLKSPKETLACEYLYQYQKTLYSYQSGFASKAAKQNVFKVLRGWVIEKAIWQGLTEFDLLRGEETYKFDWNAQSRRKQKIRCFSPNFNGRALYGATRLKRWGSRVREMLAGAGN